MQRFITPAHLERVPFHPMGPASSGSAAADISQIDKKEKTWHFYRRLEQYTACREPEDSTGLWNVQTPLPVKRLNRHNSNLIRS